MSHAIMDHTAHPHIIDTIPSYCPDDTIVKFSCTSKNYRDKLGIWLQLRHASIHRCESVAGHYLKSKSASADEHTPFHPDLVRILDIVDQCACEDDNVHLRDDTGNSVFTSVCIVRRMFGAMCWDDETYANCTISPAPTGLPSHTAVDFVDLHAEYEGFMDTHAALDPSTKTHIAHLRWYEEPDYLPDTDDQQLASYTIHLGKCRDPVDIVIVLQPHTTPGHEPGVRGASTVIGHILVELAKASHSSEDPLPIPKVTIVGIEALDYTQCEGHVYLDEPVDVANTARIDIFMDRVIHDLRENADIHQLYGSTPDDVTRILVAVVERLHEHTRFLTLHQWQMSLGSDRAVLGEWPFGISGHRAW